LNGLRVMHTNNNNTNSTAEGHASEIPADKVLAHLDEHLHTQGAVS
jgi:hypothetical protein